MCEFVPAKEKALKMQREKTMVDSRHPLGHAAIVSVFGFEQELQYISRYHRGDSPAVCTDAAVSPNPSKKLLSVPDQPEANLVVRTGCFRCTVYHTGKGIIEIRRAGG